MKRTDWAGVLVIFFLCFGVAGVGGWITAPSIPEWHAHLQKPSWNPPNWIFGPVWTTLYTMMALAASLVWCQRSRKSIQAAVVVFFIQLSLNLGWSFLFFGLHRIDLASWEIAALTVFIAITLVLFWQRSAIAGLLFVPYLTWVIFASILCWEIWHLNP